MTEAPTGSPRISMRRVDFHDSRCVYMQLSPRENFESILRRALVVVHRGRFVSEARLRQLFPCGDGGDHGYFAKDPTLKDFLSSPRAGRCLLTMVISFLSEHSVDECRRLIDDFAEGGDGGVTRGVMRGACNLPPLVSHQTVSGACVIVGDHPAPQATDPARPAPAGPLALPAGTIPAETVQSRMLPACFRPASETLTIRHIQLATH